MNPLDLINNVAFQPDCFYGDEAIPALPDIPAVQPGHEEPLTKKQRDAVKEVLETERALPPKKIDEANTLPTLKFTLAELRQFLINKHSDSFSETGYIAGGTVLNILTDGKHPKNDLDISWYVGEDFANEKTYKAYVLEFFETKLPTIISLNSIEARIAFLQQNYLIPPKDTGTFTLLQLPHLDIKFCRSEADKSSSVGAEDGFQISLTSNKARCLDRGKWLNQNDFEIARKNIDQLIYTVDRNEWPNIRHLLFRLLFKMSQGYEIKSKNKGIFEFAFEKMLKEAPLQETSNYLKLRQTFLSHQFNHYPSNESGRMIDLLNAISQGILGIKKTSDQHTFITALSKAWYKAKPRVLTNFSKILSAKPEMAPRLMKVVRGVFLLEWMRQSPEVGAYPSRKENPLRPQFCLNENGRNHFLSIDESQDPATIAVDFIKNWQELDNELDGTKLHTAFAGLAVDMGFSKLSLARESRQQVVKELISLYDLKHVKKVMRHLPKSMEPTEYFESIFRVAKNETDVTQMAHVFKELDERLIHSSKYLHIIKSLSGKCTNVDMAERLRIFLKNSLIKCVEDRTSREAILKLFKEYISFVLKTQNSTLINSAFEIAEPLLLLSNVSLDASLHDPLLQLGSAITKIDLRNFKFLKRLSNACPLDKKLQQSIQEVCIPKAIEALENHAYQPFIHALETLIQTNTLPKAAQEKCILLKQSALAQFHSNLDGFRIDFVEAMIYFDTDIAIEAVKKLRSKDMPFLAIDTLLSRILHSALKQPELMPAAYKLNAAMLSARQRNEPITTCSLYLQLLSQNEESQKDAKAIPDCLTTMCRLAEASLEDKKNTVLILEGLAKVLNSPTQPDQWNKQQALSLSKFIHALEYIPGHSIPIQGIVRGLIDKKLLQYFPQEILMKVIDLTIATDNFELYQALLVALNPIITDKADLLLDLLSKITFNTSLADKFEPLAYLFSQFLDTAGLEQEENSKLFKEKLKKFLFEKMKTVDPCKIMLLNCLALPQHDEARGVYFTNVVLEAFSELSPNPMPSLTALLANQPKDATKLLHIMKGFLYLVMARQQVKANKDTNISPMRQEIEIGGKLYRLIRSHNDLPNRIAINCIESWFALEKELEGKPVLKDLYYLSNDLDTKISISLSTDYRLMVLKEWIALFETTLLSKLDFGAHPEQSPKLFFEWLSKFAESSFNFDTKLDLKKRIEEAQLDILIRQKQIQHPDGNIEDEPDIKNEALLISIIEKIRSCIKGDPENKLDILLAELKKLTVNNDLSSLLTKQAELKQVVAQAILKTLHKELNGDLKLNDVQNAYRILELADSLQFFREEENTKSVSLIIEACSKILPGNDPECILFMLVILSDVHRWGPPTDTIEGALKEIQPNLLYKMLPIASKLMLDEPSPAQIEIAVRCLIFASQNLINSSDKDQFHKIVQTFFKKALIIKTGTFLRLAGVLARKIIEVKIIKIEGDLQQQILELGKALQQIRRSDIDENQRLEIYSQLGENLLLEFANASTDALLRTEIMRFHLKQAASLLVSSHMSSKDTQLTLSAFNRYIEGCLSIENLSAPLKEKFESVKQISSDNHSKFKEVLKTFIQAAALVDPFLAGDILSETSIYKMLSSDIRDPILLSIINTYSSQNHIDAALKGWSVLHAASFNIYDTVKRPQAKIEATLNLLSALTTSNRAHKTTNIQSAIDYISFVCKREEETVIHSGASTRASLNKAFQKACESLTAMNSSFGTLKAEALSSLAKKYKFTLADGDQISFDAVRHCIKVDKLPTIEMIDGFKLHVFNDQVEHIDSQEMIDLTLKLIHLCQKSDDHNLQTTSVSLLTQLLQSKMWPQEPSSAMYLLLNKITANLKKEQFREMAIDQLLELMINKKCFNSLDLSAGKTLLTILVQNNLHQLQKHIWERISVLQPNDQQILYQILCESNKFEFIQFAFDILRSKNDDVVYCNKLLKACAESAVLTLFPLIEEHLVKSKTFASPTISPEIQSESYKYLFDYFLKISKHDRQRLEKMSAYISCMEKLLPRAMLFAFTDPEHYRKQLESCFVECCLLTNESEFILKASNKIINHPGYYPYEMILRTIELLFADKQILTTEKSTLSKMFEALRSKQQKGDAGKYLINFFKKHLSKVFDETDKPTINALFNLFSYSIYKSKDIELLEMYEKLAIQFTLLFSRLQDQNNLMILDQNLRSGDFLIAYNNYVKNIKAHLSTHCKAVEKLTDKSSLDTVKELVKTTSEMVLLFNSHEFNLGINVIKALIPYLKRNPQQLIPNIFFFVDNYNFRPVSSLFNFNQNSDEQDSILDLEVFLIENLIECNDLRITDQVLNRLQSLTLRYASPLEREYVSLFASFRFAFQQTLMDRAVNPLSTAPEKFKAMLGWSLNNINAAGNYSEYLRLFLLRTINLLTWYPHHHKQVLSSIDEDLPIKLPKLIDKVQHLLKSDFMKTNLHFTKKGDSVSRDLLNEAIAFLPFFKTDEELDASRQDQFTNWTYTYLIEILECVMTSDKFINIFKSIGSQPGFYTSDVWKDMSKVLSFTFASLKQSKLDNKAKMDLQVRFAKILSLNPALKDGWTKEKDNLLNFQERDAAQKAQKHMKSKELIKKIIKKLNKS